MQRYRSPWCPLCLTKAKPPLRQYGHRASGGSGCSIMSHSPLDHTPGSTSRRNSRCGRLGTARRPPRQSAQMHAGSYYLCLLPNVVYTRPPRISGHRPLELGSRREYHLSQEETIMPDQMRRIDYYCVTVPDSLPRGIEIQRQNSYPRPDRGRPAPAGIRAVNGASLVIPHLAATARCMPASREPYLVLSVATTAVRACYRVVRHPTGAGPQLPTTGLPESLVV